MTMSVPESVPQSVPPQSVPQPRGEAPGERAVRPPGRLRAGVVGLGHQALEDHVPGLAGCDGADLVAVCDADPDLVGVQQEALGVPGYTDVERMLAAEGLDFVVVTVPHHAGRAVVEAAAGHGVHVLKEKPFATSLAEAQALSALCEAAGIQLMVTLQRRFNPIYTSFLQLADRIGAPFVVDAAYTLHVPDPSDGWRGEVATAGGGCVIDMGYHLVDMLIWYFGLPDRVYADLSTTARPDRRYDAEDTALIQFGYDGGLYGSLLLSRFIGPKTERIRVVGSRGIVDLERGRLRRLDNAGEVVESLSREQGWPSASASQIDHFCRVIEGLRPNPSAPGDHLAHAAFITACYASAATHAPVNPKDAL
jgi:predicted dehydrogenase